MAKLTCTVAVEKAMHNVISGTLQQISDKYGLTVQSVSANWIDVSGTEGDGMMLTGLSICADSKHSVGNADGGE
ncbi:MAG: hypothetical protein KJ630_19025 [Proteobacteria bacterium]|nr:hypothetical protein [Pseudomonadota bacterium]